MQPLFLNFYQRVMVWNFVGAQSVQSLKEAAVLLRVIEKVRLVDEESTQSKFQQSGERISWNLPEPGYGDKFVELENEEAKALVQVIEAVQGIRVNDAQWLIPMIERLSAERSVQEEVGTR